MVIVVPLNWEQTVGMITFVKEEQQAQVAKQQEKQLGQKSSPIGEKIDSLKDEEETQRDTQRRYVHTLNTVSGFLRKLEAIGINIFGDKHSPQKS